MSTSVNRKVRKRASASTSKTMDKVYTDLCPSCGGLNTPGGTEVCPACEDLQAAALELEYPPGDPTGAGRVPPHGNTTR